MSSRTKGREYAVQILYQSDCTGEDPVTSLRLFRDHFAQTEEAGKQLDEETAEFTDGLVHAVAEHRRELDNLIERASINWRIERMPRVDRNVLRVAVCELRFSEQVPVAVIINEAIEIGKRFGSEDSGSFINGILDRVAQEMGRAP